MCNELFCVAPECEDGFVFQRCGPSCPQTCEFLNSAEPQDCDIGCAEGCFCPFGKVVIDNVCKDPRNCAGMSQCSLVCLKFIHSQCKP